MADIRKFYQWLQSGIVCRNICSEYEIEPLRSRWETRQKVVKTNRSKFLWDSQIQTDRKVLANQPDIVVVDKQKKEAMVIDVAVPRDSNIKKEYEKLEKYQGSKGTGEDVEG